MQKGIICIILKKIKLGFNSTIDCFDLIFSQKSEKSKYKNLEISE